MDRHSVSCVGAALLLGFWPWSFLVLADASGITTSDAANDTAYNPTILNATSSSSTRFSPSASSSASSSDGMLPSSSAALDKFIASGLGIYSSSNSVSWTSTISETVRPTQSFTISLSSSYWPNATISTTSTTAGPSSPGNSTSANSTLGNFTYTGDCWDQWNEYWSISVFDRGLFESTQTIVATVTTPVPEISITEGSGDYTLTETETETSVSYNGAFPVTSDAYTTTITDAVISQSFTVTFTITTGYTSELTTATNTTTIAYSTAKNGALTTPACVLPSIVPQCQSQWDAWLVGNQTDPLPFTCSYCNAAARSSASASWTSGEHTYEYTIAPPRYGAGFTPICSQASIAQTACSSIIGSFLAPPFAPEGDINPAPLALTPWPSTSTLAPGCTLGCQTCAITGDSVQLFYWPTSSTTTGNLSGVAQPTITPGPETQVLNLNGTNFTFTSPTIYISYHLLYASDSCSGRGKTYTNTIIPLANSKDLSSLSYFGGAGVIGAPGYSTESFNLADLNTPIPDSIYNRDPRCQASLWVFNEGGGNYTADGTTHTFSCPRTEPYAPIIAVPTEVKHLDPAWASCTAWYGGLYDPPKALTGTDAEIGATTPNVGTTSTPASPSSSVGSGQPPATSAPQTSSDAPQSPPAGSLASPGSTGPAQVQSSQPTVLPDTQSNSDSGQTTINPATEPRGGSSVPLTASNSAGAADGSTSAAGGSPGTGVFSSPGDPSSTSTTPIDSGTNGASSGSSRAGPSGTASANGPGSATTGPFTFASATVTAVASSGALIIDGTTVQTASTQNGKPGSQNTQIVTAGANTLTVVQSTGSSGNGGVVIIGQTLTSGQAATIFGVALSAESAGVVLGGSSTIVAPAPSGDSGSSVVGLGSSSFAVVQIQASGSNAVVVANGGSTTTLTPGSIAVFGGQTITAAPSGGAVIGNGNGAVTVPANSGPSQVGGGTQVITTLGQTLTVVQTGGAGSAIVVGGSTLSAGGPQTIISGVTISGGNNGGLVINGQTTTIPQPGASGSQNAQAVVTGSNGQSVSVIQQGSSVFLADRSSSTTQSSSTTIPSNQQSSSPVPASASHTTIRSAAHVSKVVISSLLAVVIAGTCLLFV